MRKQLRERYVANSEEIIKKKLAWRNANIEKARAIERRSAGCPEPTRPRPRACECCGSSPAEKSLCVDHCHVSAAFRGWLCDKCNRGLGMLGDNIEGLMNAVRYLERAAKQQEN
jgi:hypothetical protein